MKTTNMATTSRSIAEELLGNIPMLNAFQLHALVPYLSPEDATTIDNFEESELAEDYYVETINLRYGKLETKIMSLMFSQNTATMRTARTRG